MDFYKEIACQEIGKKAKTLKILGDSIWKYAETGYETHKSRKAICRLLEKNEFRVIRDLRGIKCTFMATYGHVGSGRNRSANIGILCRYDAVPKKGHVNGTNLQAEVAVAAALGLKAVISSTADNIGQVTVIGCPNMEGGALIPLFRLRMFRGLDIILTAAPGTRTVWHPLYVGCSNFKALYYGAAAEPEKFKPEKNALDASIQAYTNMLAIQEHFGRGWKAAGSIAQPGSITVDRRLCQTTVKISAPTNPHLSFMTKRILPCLKAAATSADCKVDINQGEYTIPCLVSNIQLGYLLQLNAYHCGILSEPRKARVMIPPTDSAEVSRRLPTIRPHFYIGTDAKPGTVEFKKAAKSSDAHNYAMAMGKALAMTAIDILHTPEALNLVREDLVESMKNESMAKFTPFSTGVPAVHTDLVMAEVPADTGATGWNRVY